MDALAKKAYARMKPTFKVPMPDGITHLKIIGASNALMNEMMIYGVKGDTREASYAKEVYRRWQTKMLEETMEDASEVRELDITRTEYDEWLAHAKWVVAQPGQMVLMHAYDMDKVDCETEVVGDDDDMYRFSSDCGERVVVPGVRAVQHKEFDTYLKAVRVTGGLENAWVAWTHHAMKEEKDADNYPEGVDFATTAFYIRSHTTFAA